MKLIWIKASELFTYEYVGLRSAPVTKYIQPSVEDIGWQDHLSPHLVVSVSKKEVYDGISRLAVLKNLDLGLVALECRDL